MIKAIKGTNDILPSDIDKWLFLESIARKVFRNYNYKEIRTPVFEETALFARGIGEETDIVSKEMYTFTDRSETSVTLKPEMTAAVVRAFIEHSLQAQQQLQKLFYISPMFRQERPQAGRLRQFHQYGIEALGSNSPLLDAEVIIVAYEILRELGLKHLSLKINSLGQPESREKYQKELYGFLKDKKEKLSNDSQTRLETNILRVLDSKDENDIELLKDAPMLLDYLDERSIAHFDEVKALLNASEIEFETEPKLVRGLDYYTDTTFEITSSKIGAQSALCGGGRYDYLIEQLGGKPTPGVGFAAGIERILMAAENEGVLSEAAEPVDCYIVQIDKEKRKDAFAVADSLRKEDFTVEMDYLARSVKAQMREANKINTRYVIFIGGEEFENKAVSLKDMETGDQREVKIEELSKEIKRRID